MSDMMGLDDDDVSAAGDNDESSASRQLMEGRSSRQLLRRQLQFHLAAICCCPSSDLALSRPPDTTLSAILLMECERADQRLCFAVLI